MSNTTTTATKYLVTYRKYDTRDKTFYGTPTTAEVEAENPNAAKRKLYSYFGGARQSGIRAEKIEIATNK